MFTGGLRFFFFRVGENASLGGGGKGRILWRDAVADHTPPDSYGARAEPYVWQVAVAVAVAAIVLSNYHDMSSLLHRVAFTVGACARACACASACQCARVSVCVQNRIHSHTVRPATSDE